MLSARTSRSRPVADFEVARHGELAERGFEPGERLTQASEPRGVIEVIARGDDDVRLEGVDDLDGPLFVSRLLVAVQVGDLDDAKTGGLQLRRLQRHGVHVDPAGLDEIAVEQAGEHRDDEHVNHDRPAGEQDPPGRAAVRAAIEGANQYDDFQAADRQDHQTEDNQGNLFSKRQRNHWALMIPLLVTSSAIRCPGGTIRNSSSLQRPSTNRCIRPESPGSSS